VTGPPRSLPDPAFLLITDSAQAGPPLADICAAASRAGCRWFMVREKGIGSAELVALTREILAAVEPGASVIVNGDAEAARLAGASGVHLQNIDAVAAARASLSEDNLIGYSAHSIADAAVAARAGADYVTLSPVFETQSKPGYGPALGLAGISSAVRELEIPVIALAGITTGNIGDVRASGVAGVAVMGEVMRAADPAAVSAALLAAFLQ